jgi:hypothetical protein
MAGKYKGQTGTMRGFTLAGKSAYVLLDWKGGSREEEEKCLRLTSLTLTDDVHGDRVNITAGKYKGLTGMMRGFTPSRKSAYVLLDGEGGAQGEKEKCLRLTSLTLTKKEVLVWETVPKNCSCGVNSGSGHVHGDRIAVMVGKHKGQTGVVRGCCLEWIYNIHRRCPYNNNTVLTNNQVLKLKSYIVRNQELYQWKTSYSDTYSSLAKEIWPKLLTTIQPTGPTTIYTMICMLGNAIGPSPVNLLN